MALQLVQSVDIKNARNKTNNLNAEYFAEFGKKIESTDTNRTVTNCGLSIIDGWNTAYGLVQIIPKKHKKYFWAFNIEQHHRKYSSIVIGIEEIKTGINCLKKYFHGQTDTKNYAYKSNGKKYSHIISSGVNFSDNYSQQGSIVAMLIDGYSLSFCKLSDNFCRKHKINTIEEYIQYGAWVVAENNIPHNTKYRMAVSLYGKTKLFGAESSDQSAVKLLKYTFTVSEVVEDEDSDDDEEDDNYYEVKDNGNAGNLKDKLISLEAQLANFERKYNDKKISAAYSKNCKSIEVLSDINKLKTRLTSFTQHIGNMENYISSILYPDITEYETWNIPQMIQWIASLDNGAYIKYLDVLQKGFEVDNICSGELLCELTIDSLRNKPFNIKDMMARKKLVHYFQTLKRGNQRYNTYQAQYY